ncbi:hypothetical protein INR49_020932 [Caranx melampygus]|nr:hypothetical protein INR49_020932 [Caranx melampygus]
MKSMRKNKNFFVELGEPRLLEMSERKGHALLTLSSVAMVAITTESCRSQCVKTLSVRIIDHEEYDRQASFYIQLQEPDWKRRRWTASSCYCHSVAPFFTVSQPAIGQDQEATLD